MKNRNLFMLIVSIVISVGIIASPVWAGNVQRNRWEGLAIGVGAAILGKDIVMKAEKDGQHLERKKRSLKEIEIL